MPWLSIIMFIVSYFLSKKSGKSDAQSALIGAGVGLGTYYLADPSNANNLFGIGVDSSATAATTASSVTTPTVANGSTTSTGGAWTSTVDAAGKVLTSWGASGTALVAGTVAATTSDNKWLWLAAGAAILLLLK